MKVACVGAGPAGLYFALLLKMRNPSHDVKLFERNAYGVTQGWGVVFWDDLLHQLYRADPESARQIHEAKDGIALLEKLFERPLAGHRLMEQPHGHANARWLNFRTVTNRRWYEGRTVLAGDAAHTTHFTIGSGSTLAMQDAISLADNVQRHADLPSALQSYEQERQSALLKSQTEARYSGQWFENITRYIDLQPYEFSELLRARRSPLLPRVSPRLYYHLYHQARAVPVIRRARRLVGPTARALHAIQDRRPAEPARVTSV